MLFNKIGGGAEKVKIDGQTPPGKLNLKKEKIWKRISALPTPSFITDESRSIPSKIRPFVYKNNIYTINQYHTGSSSSDLPKTQQMKFENNNWVNGKTHDFYYSYLESGNINGIAYAINSDHVNSPKKITVYKFNEGETWTKISEHDVYSYGLIGTTITDNAIYALLKNTENKTNLVEFNPNTKQWTIKSKNTPINKDSSETKIIKFKNELHFIGSGTNISYAQEHYKFNGSIWTKLNILPAYFINFNAIANKDKIYALGVRKNKNAWYNESGKAYEYNGSNWTYIPNFPLKYMNRNTGVLLKDNNILILNAEENNKGTCIIQETIYTEEREV